MSQILSKRILLQLLFLLLLVVWQATKQAVAKQRWDYRWQPVPRKCKLDFFFQWDLYNCTMLLFCKGHKIVKTLYASLFKLLASL